MILRIARLSPKVCMMNAQGQARFCVVLLFFCFLFNFHTKFPRGGFNAWSILIKISEKGTKKQNKKKYQYNITIIYTYIIKSVCCFRVLCGECGRWPIALTSSIPPPFRYLFPPPNVFQIFPPLKACFAFATSVMLHMSAACSFVILLWAGVPYSGVRLTHGGWLICLQKDLQVTSTWYKWTPRTMFRTDRSAW